MSMLDGILFSDLKKPSVLFCLGWAGVLLSLTVSIPPVWNTFIHLWRVEFFASIFLSVVLIATYFIWRDRGLRLDISKHEITFIVLPIIALICWSALSSLWAPSWRSAIHHATVWSEYLIFYLAIRHFLNRGHNYGKLMDTTVGALAFFAVLAAFGYCSFLILGSGSSLGIIY